MPYISIKAYPRDKATNQKLVEAINQTVQNVIGCPPEALTILFEEVAKKKKAGEDKVFEKMDNRWQDYAESHLASTAKRFAGREPEVIEDDFCNKYGK